MTEQDAMKFWVDTWKQTGPELEAIRLRELREQGGGESGDSAQRAAIAQLVSAIDFATRKEPPAETSGLIEMQRLFAKLRSDSNGPSV